MRTSFRFMCPRSFSTIPGGGITSLSSIHKNSFLLRSRNCSWTRFLASGRYVLPVTIISSHGIGRTLDIMCFTHLANTTSSKGIPIQMGVTRTIVMASRSSAMCVSGNSPLSFISCIISAIFSLPRPELAGTVSFLRGRLRFPIQYLVDIHSFVNLKCPTYGCIIYHYTYVSGTVSRHRVYFY